jgi:hypothetical protein
LENYQQLKKLYSLLITKKLKEGSNDTIFSNSIKKKLTKIILTLNKINISLASQKSDLTNYSLLRKVNDKLFPYRTTKINQISRLIQFKNLRTLTLFLKDVHLKDIFVKKDLLFFKDITKLWQQKYDQILISCIRTNFDITQSTDLISEKLELWLAVKKSGFKKYESNWFWSLAIDNLNLLFGAKTKKSRKQRSGRANL